MITQNDMLPLGSSFNGAEYKIIRRFHENLTSNNILTDVQAGCIHTATLAVSTVLVIFVLFLGCTGNGIVLFNALTAKLHRNNFELLVINLAGADFILCTCLSPMFLFLLFSESNLPKVFCGSVLFLGVLSALLSLLSLVAVAVYRTCQIVGTLKRPLSLAKMSAIVGLIWILSTLIALCATFHVTTSWQDDRIDECQNAVNNRTPESNNFVLYFVSPMTIISLLTIAICYGVIASVARSVSRAGEGVVPLKSPECQHENLCESGAPDKTTDVSITIGKCVPPSGDLKPDNGQKATTMCFVVTLTVILCWGPLIMSQFVQLFKGYSIILYQVKLCGIALIFLNSALNPYLYGQSNSKVNYRYIRVLYNFAKCDFPVVFGRTSKQCGGRDASERCPLNQSMDKLTSNSSRKDCDSCSHLEDISSRQYMTNIQYVHSLMVFGRPDRTAGSEMVNPPEIV